MQKRTHEIYRGGTSASRRRALSIRATPKSKVNLTICRSNRENRSGGDAISITSGYNQSAIGVRPHPPRQHELEAKELRMNKQGSE